MIVNQSIFVVDAQYGVDKYTGCVTSIVVDGSGAVYSILNPTKYPVNLGDLIEISRNKNVTYRVKNEGIEWYNLGEEAKPEDFVMSLREQTIATLFKTKEDIDAHFEKLDYKFAYVPYAFQMRIKFWRDNNKYFRFLYEEREISIAIEIANRIESRTLKNDIFQNDILAQEILYAYHDGNDRAFLLACDHSYSIKTVNQSSIDAFIEKYNLPSRKIVGDIRTPILIKGRV